MIARSAAPACAATALRNGICHLASLSIVLLHWTEAMLDIVHRMRSKKCVSAATEAKRRRMCQNGEDGHVYDNREDFARNFQRICDAGMPCFPLSEEAWPKKQRMWRGGLDFSAVGGLGGGAGDDADDAMMYSSSLGVELKECLPFGFPCIEVQAGGVVC